MVLSFRYKKKKKKCIKLLLAGSSFPSWFVGVTVGRGGDSRSSLASIFVSTQETLWAFRNIYINGTVAQVAQVLHSTTKNLLKKYT